MEKGSREVLTQSLLQRLWKAGKWNGSSLFKISYHGPGANMRTTHTLAAASEHGCAQVRTLFSPIQTPDPGPAWWGLSPAALPAWDSLRALPRSVPADARQQPIQIVVLFCFVLKSVVRNGLE